MIKYKLNEPFYKLHFSELPEDAVRVLSFEGEEGISQLFEYRLTLLSDDPELNAADILNKKATFTLTRGDDEPVHVHGLISHFEQRGRDTNHVFYYAVLVPKMWRLNLTYQSEVYQEMDMEKLIAKVMETAGFASDDFEINLTQSYPPQEYTVQYRETNFNFLNRRLEHFGIYYYFDHRDGNDVMVFTDANNNLPEIAQTAALSYNPKRDILGETETIGTLTCREKVVTGLVKLKDYNYLDPNTDLTAESRIDAEAPGMYYEFGDHFADKSQAAFLAKVRNEEIIAGSKIFQGVSDCRLFRAGFKFAIDKHYREAWNGEYLLTRVTARGAQKSLFGSLSPSAPDDVPTYENKFEAIPVDIAYRPPRRTPVPRVAGIMSAKIESGSGDEYAFIDDHGRYRAKMLFDLTDRRNGEATLAIRQVQAYSGSGYGMHFPNHADTELVWACVDGNVDRPVSLGTVPNPSNASPSTGGNKAQSVIRTAGQNELTLDDTSGGENIYLHATKDHTIQITNDKKQTVGNNEALEVGTNRTKSIGNDETVSIGNNRSKTVGADQIEKIGKNNTLDVGVNHQESIGADKSVAVGANQDVKIGKNKKEKVGGSFLQKIARAKVESVGLAKMLNIGGAYQVTVGAVMNETITFSRTEQVGMTKTAIVGMNSMEKVGKNKTINAGKKIELICGKGKIVIEESGKILIEGTELNLTATEGNVIIKGKVVDIN